MTGVEDWEANFEEEWRKRWEEDLAAPAPIDDEQAAADLSAEFLGKRLGKYRTSRLEDDKFERDGDYTGEELLYRRKTLLERLEQAQSDPEVNPADIRRLKRLLADVEEMGREATDWKDAARQRVEDDEKWFSAMLSTLEADRATIELTKQIEWLLDQGGEALRKAYREKFGDQAISRELDLQD